MSDDKEITVPQGVVSIIYTAIKAAVVGTSIIAWTMFLDVRDLRREVSAFYLPGAALNGSLSRTDWEYEKKLLLINHELVRNEVAVLRSELTDYRRSDQ